MIKKLFLAFLFSATIAPAMAQIRLPRLVRDSMVLQRDANVNIWGWASPGEKVRVSFNGKKYNATTSGDGKWSIKLQPTKAGGPFVMNIDGSNHITLHNILVGDVWVCSGQSNMVHQMALHRERYAAEIANANYSQIRHFWIPTLTDLTSPHDDLPSGYWKSANPQDVLQFSAAAYFFGKKIYEKYHVPIGLINASVGGSPIEAWLSEEGLKEFPSVISVVQKNKDTAYVNGTNRAAAEWNNSRPKPQDKGMLETTQWFETAYAPKQWRTITLPGYWEDQGVRNLDGIVWYRKEIDIPVKMIGVPAKLALGRIVDADFIYVNGKLVGNTAYQYPQRRYEVPAGVLKEGTNVLVVRVLNYSGKGGFVPDKPYYLAANHDTVDLKGDWMYKVGAAFPQQIAPPSIAIQNQPTALYNAMLAPVTNYSVKGILWYQGESNINNAGEYDKLLPALINDWRSKWSRSDLPFLFAQLPNFGDVDYLPTESPWAVLREAQRKTLSVPNTGMAVTIDAGEWNDIHPDRKKEVGDRLALQAMKIVYGEKNLVASGPLYHSNKVDGNKIIVSFTEVGSGLTTSDGETPNEFAIAGEDKKFVWAKARLEGDKVVVWSDGVPSPKYVRYAWADNPDNPNLYNKEGLPASPFQTGN